LNTVVAERLQLVDFLDSLGSCDEIDKGVVEEFDVNNNNNNDNSSRRYRKRAADTVAVVAYNIEPSTNLPLFDMKSKPVQVSHIIQRQEERMPEWQRASWKLTNHRLQTLIEGGRQLVGAEICTLFLYDKDSQSLYAHSAVPDAVDIQIGTNTGIAGFCYTEGMQVNSHIAYLDTRFCGAVDRKLRSPTKAMLAFPVRSAVKIENHGVVGVLEVLNKKKDDTFTLSNEHEIRLVAYMIGCTLDVVFAEEQQQIVQRIINRHTELTETMLSST